MSTNLTADLTAAGSEPVNAASITSFLEDRRSARNPRTVMDRLYRLYLVLIAAGLTIYFVSPLLSGALPSAPAARSAAVARSLPVWLPATLLLLALGALRAATWQGPVVLSKPDVRWLLFAPIRRADLIRRPLLRGLGIAIGLAELAGLALFTLLASTVDAPPAPILGATLGGLAGLGVLIWAMGWLVECDAQRARWVLRATVPVGAAAFALIALGGDTAVRRIALWSGPWGWAAQPVVAATGGSAPGWPVAVALLVAAAVGATTLAWKAMGGAPVEELERRAGLNTSFRAALFFLDFRSAARARRDGMATLRGVHRWSLPLPPIRVLAIPWRDLLALSREPGRLIRAAVIVAATAGIGVTDLLSTTDAGRAVRLALMAIVGYFAAASLAEPLRVEAEQRFADRWLTWPTPDVICFHLAAPAVVLSLLSVGAVGVTVALGGLSASAFGPVAVAAVLASILLTGSAAIAALGEPPDFSLLFLGEIGFVLIAGKLARGVQVALLGVFLPAVVTAATVANDGVGPWEGIRTVVFAVLAIGGAMVAWIRTRELPVP